MTKRIDFFEEMISLVVKRTLRNIIHLDFGFTSDRVSQMCPCSRTHTHRAAELDPKAKQRATTRH